MELAGTRLMVTDTLFMPSVVTCGAWAPDARSLNGRHPVLDRAGKLALGSSLSLSAKVILFLPFQCVPGLVTPHAAGVEFHLDKRPHNNNYPLFIVPTVLCLKLFLRSNFLFLSIEQVLIRFTISNSTRKLTSKILQHSIPFHTLLY